MYASCSGITTSTGPFKSTVTFFDADFLHPVASTNKTRTMISRTEIDNAKTDKAPRKPLFCCHSERSEELQSFFEQQLQPEPREMVRFAQQLEAAPSYTLPQYSLTIRRGKVPERYERGRLPSGNGERFRDWFPRCQNFHGCVVTRNATHGAPALGA